MEWKSMVGPNLTTNVADNQNTYFITPGREKADKKYAHYLKGIAVNSFVRLSYLHFSNWISMLSKSLQTKQGI